MPFSSIFFIALPLMGFLVSCLPGNHQERPIFLIAFSTLVMSLLGLLIFTGGWWSAGYPPIFEQVFTLYQTQHSEYSIALYFDKFTAIYSVVATLLIGLVTIFSQYYLHREKGYKRFFNNMLFFYTGIQLILFAGNLETLFIGWEIIGIASFFLIAFYQDRYLPVKNALKVVSLYRIADVLLLLVIWQCHHYFHTNITFLQLTDMSPAHSLVLSSPVFQWTIPLCFLGVAWIKSAQFPFSFWLPRAMEGPTTSSAIFYGSISVHIGLFLMIRVAPLWEGLVYFKIVMAIGGLLTCVVASLIAGVQSSVKAQIAYSSIAQIGLMFVEVAMGWYEVAMVHFATNAFLRTYQLLVSPSVLSYLIHDQFFNFVPPPPQQITSVSDKWRWTLFVWSLKEFNLDGFFFRYLWQPAKHIGKRLHFLNTPLSWVLIVGLYAVGLYFAYHKEQLSAGTLAILPSILVTVGLVVILQAFTWRGDARVGWFMIMLNQIILALGIAFNEQFSYEQVHLYLSGIFVAFGMGLYCLQRLHKRGERIDLQQFNGYVYKYPRVSTLFMIASLGMAGFPITPTFIGEDLLLGHIQEGQHYLIVVFAACLMLNGISVFRLYARVFLGAYQSGYHVYAYRSS